jgi:hypothetical protein
MREGRTDPAICDAIDGLRQIDKKIKAAKNYLVKFERGEELSQEEEDLARTLLEVLNLLALLVQTYKDWSRRLLEAAHARACEH